MRNRAADACRNTHSRTTSSTWMLAMNSWEQQLNRGQNVIFANVRSTMLSDVLCMGANYTTSYDGLGWLAFWLFPKRFRTSHFSLYHWLLSLAAEGGSWSSVNGLISELCLSRSRPPTHFLLSFTGYILFHSEAIYRYVHTVYSPLQGTKDRQRKYGFPTWLTLGN